MGISSFFRIYFNSFFIINDKTVAIETRRLARICVISYFFVLPLVIFGIGYALSNLSNIIWKSEKKISHISDRDQINVKIEEKFSTTFDKEKKLREGSKTYPKVSEHLKPSFFVDVLNNNGYLINDKIVEIPFAGRPEKYTYSRIGEGIKGILDNLRAEYQLKKVNILFKFKDLSTEQAINVSKGTTIALNFANQEHAGGGPGFHKDPVTKLFVYDSPSAKAQEESICQRSNLMDSLTQLPHTLQADPGSRFIRSYYVDNFDSRHMAYISGNHLFAVQDNQNFYHSHYLEEPKAVIFITSAANYYGNVDMLDCSTNSDVYKDATQRIETHLLAAAFKACISKKEKPDQPVELILGAFGCGAFAPQINPDEYRKMIAHIYKKLLPEFEGIFDVVTFAVPTFGDKNLSSAAVANHRIFKNVFNYSDSPYFKGNVA